MLWALLKILHGVKVTFILQSQKLYNKHEKNKNNKDFLPILSDKLQVSFYQSMTGNSSVPLGFYIEKPAQAVNNTFSIPSLKLNGRMGREAATLFPFVKNPFFCSSTGNTILGFTFLYIKWHLLSPPFFFVNISFGI